MNDKIVPIKHILQNGDKVEIFTSKAQTPKRDWLQFVQTSKAKARIKKYLKESAHVNADEGKEIVIRKLNQVKIKFADDSVFKLIKHYKVKDALELYLGAAENKFDWSELKTLFFPEKNEDDKKPNQIDTKDFKQKVNRKINSVDNFLIIENSVDNIVYRLGKCCNPIKGDDVFGFLTASGGFTIHRITCPNANELLNKYPYRVVKTHWTQNEANDSRFLVGIKVVGVDEIGIISTITQVISQDLKVNMRDINVLSDDDIFEGKISLYIKDNNHLETLLKKIRNIKGVHFADRYDER
ncbi:MAG: bifunctional (p)ppGpp synthetase/guanosine-3',5'-bis(diphosphate) 3'-pyrophosphohydrolase [Bacteroidales bacterium]|nr:bifunctional (p)ppGpp synthetase/guanosine-3',5'-bis(diphosphate) 3'-pyrophosphohydrolase [Bacteroidales bacterium]